MTENPTEHSLSLDEFALRQGCTTRTVRRWIDAGELPTAFRDPFTTEWRFPIDAHRQRGPKLVPEATGQELAHPGPGSAVWWPTGQDHDVVPAEPTRLDQLDEETTFMSVADASHYLGIPQVQIKANAETFGLMAVGRRLPDGTNALMVPKSIIRKFEGK